MSDREFLAMSQPLAIDFRKTLLRFLSAVLFFSLTVGFFSWSMGNLEQRVGSVFPDPVLRHWHPISVSFQIFILTWGTVVISVVTIARDLPRLTQLAVAYSVLELMRILAIWLMPLEPPPLMITLDDPINDNLIFDRTVTKDLFFSGHVSAIWLLSCYFGRLSRMVLRLAAFVVAALLLAQHVHYSIDVAAAPFFATLAYRAGILWTSYWDRKDGQADITSSTV